jgi:hypothetical protein
MNYRLPIDLDEMSRRKEEAARAPKTVLERETEEAARKLVEEYAKEIMAAANIGEKAKAHQMIARALLEKAVQAAAATTATPKHKELESYEAGRAAWDKAEGREPEVPPEGGWKFTPNAPGDNAPSKGNPRDYVYGTAGQPAPVEVRGPVFGNTGPLTPPGAGVAGVSEPPVYATAGQPVLYDTFEIKPEVKEHRIPVEGGPDMVFMPVPGQPGMFTTNYSYREGKIEVDYEKEHCKVSERETRDLPWPEAGEIFAWTRMMDTVQAETLYRLCAKRLRELGAMR